MIVVKVGGSLYDHPRLGPGLRAFLDSLGEPVLLVPGGGPFTDAVRNLDRIHGLGEEVSHQFAMKSLWLSADLLQNLVPGLDFAVHPDAMPPSSLMVLDGHVFGMIDRELPHSWNVTSDSIAARAAVIFSATRLILLKSIDIPLGTSWSEAAERGWVDPHFPTIVETANLTVEAINFRRVLSGGSLPPALAATLPLG